MPIRPENKARYPKNWKAISLAIREAAGQKCEKCAAPNGAMIGRGIGRDAGTYWHDGLVRNAETGEALWYQRASEYEGAAPVKVVLTVAHLNHVPEDCRPENLRAWCQRCHNRHDAKTRAAGIKERRRATAAAGDLFVECKP